MTVSIANLTSQWNNNTISFTGIGMNVNATAYATDSYIINYKLNGIIRYTLDPLGNVFVGGTHTVNSDARVNGSLVVANAIASNVITSNTITVNSITANSITITSGTGNVIGNNITGNTVTSNTFVRDSKGDVRNIPVFNTITGYGLSLDDTGEIISTNTTIFVPNNIFFAGNAVSIFNNSATSITVTQNSSVTMYLAGTATTGNRTLAQRGVATVLCVAANTFVISGAGLS